MSPKGNGGQKSPPKIQIRTLPQARALCVELARVTGQPSRPTITSEVLMMVALLADLQPKLIELAERYGLRARLRPRLALGLLHLLDLLQLWRVSLAAERLS